MPRASSPGQDATTSQPSRLAILAIPWHERAYDEAMTVIDWLLDSDPAHRWQVLRDLTDATDDEVRAERTKVAHEGRGAALLAAQDADGRWGGGTFFPRGT